MDSLKSYKVAILPRKRVHMTGPKYLEFFQKVFNIDFGTQKSSFERNFVKLSFITNLLSKASDTRPCLTLNISIANY